MEKYLWRGKTTLLAIYDGNDNLLTLFQYADARMPLAMSKNGTNYYLCYDQAPRLQPSALDRRRGGVPAALREVYR